MSPNASGAAPRVLALGAAGADGLAGRVAGGGLIIAFEADRRRADRARERFARAGVGDRAHVMVGDPVLLLSKVAGPFDVIVLEAGFAGSARVANRLASLLAPGGEVVTRQVSDERPTE
jgi:predicted O-methyltransferase YrrM